jgi:hypothetical protein
MARRVGVAWRTDLPTTGCMSTGSLEYDAVVSAEHRISTGQPNVFATIEMTRVHFLCCAD